MLKWLLGQRRIEALPLYHVRFLPVERSPDGLDIWAACFEEIPGCIGQGNTSGEAEAMLHRILPEYLNRLRKHGQPIPSPHHSGGIQSTGAILQETGSLTHGSVTRNTGNHQTTARVYA